MHSRTHGPPWSQYPSVMPSAHCDSSGNSGSGGHCGGFGGRGADGSLRAHHNTDCGQPMLTPVFQLSRKQRTTTTCATIDAQLIKSSYRRNVLVAAGRRQLPPPHHSKATKPFFSAPALMWIIFSIFILPLLLHSCGFEAYMMLTQFNSYTSHYSTFHNCTRHHHRTKNICCVCVFTHCE